MQKANVFNRDFYDNSQIEVENLIKETLDWKNNEGFILDGIRDRDTYEKQKIKILVLLGESYGFGRCGMQKIEGQLTLDAVKKIPTLQKIGALLWLIFKSLEKDQELSLGELSNLFKKYPELKEALLKAAWVNVKKVSEKPSRQNPHHIREHAEKNKKILQKQIKSIAPDLIIVCSAPVMNSLCDLSLLGDGITNEKNKVKNNLEGQKIIYVSHPSYYRDWGYNGLYNTYKTIYQCIK